MSFDAHSLERLRKLGRQLPQPLPAPQPAVGAAPRASEKRHKVETETDPEALFHELMQVSPDGTVPPHLIDRLRRVEENKQRQRREERLRQDPPAGGGPPPAPRQGELRPNRNRRQPAGSEEQQLYTEFQALLLEGEGDE